MIQVIKGSRRPNQFVGAERRLSRPPARANPGAVLPWWPTRCANWPNALAGATGEISLMITEIQQSSRDAVGSMHSAVQQVNAGRSWRRTLWRGDVRIRNSTRQVTQTVASISESILTKASKHHCRAGRQVARQRAKAPLPASRLPRPRPWRNRPARTRLALARFQPDIRPGHYAARVVNYPTRLSAWYDHLLIPLNCSTPSPYARHPGVHDRSSGGLHLARRRRAPTRTPPC